MASKTYKKQKPKKKKRTYLLGWKETSSTAISKNNLAIVQIFTVLILQGLQVEKIK